MDTDYLVVGAGAMGVAFTDALVDHADVVLENYRPGVMSRLGLGPDVLLARNPRVVVASISGYGQDDPRTCLDTIAQCESGFAWINGADEATPVVVYVGNRAEFATMLDVAPQVDRRIAHLALDRLRTIRAVS